MTAFLPLKVKAGTPILRGHDHYWAVMRALDKKHGSFTVYDIWQASNQCDKNNIRIYLKKLVAGGFAEIIEHRKTTLYRLVKRPKQAPSLTITGEVSPRGRSAVHMWNAIRKLPRFDVNDIAFIGTSDDVVIAKETARRYLRHLYDAGYLHIVKKGRGGQFTVYSLKLPMNTGPLSPKIINSIMVYDQNRGAIMGDAYGEEKQP